jgi:hypothetical protein
VPISVGMECNFIIFQVGAVARYHCNEGYRLLMLFGQDLYRCTAAGNRSSLIQTHHHSTYCIIKTSIVLIPVPVLQIMHAYALVPVGS